MCENKTISKIIEVAQILAELEEELEANPDNEEKILITLLERYGISHACGGAVDDCQSQLVFIFNDQLYEWSAEEGCGMIDDSDRIEHIRIKAEEKGYEGFEDEPCECE